MAREYKDVVVGLDIGTAKVMAVVAEVLPNGALKLAGLGVAPSNGLKRGVVVNIDATVQSIQQALKEAELMADCKIQRVYTGITGSHIRGQNSRGMVAIKDKEVTATDVARVVETAKAISISSDQRLLLVEPQEFIIDGQEVKEPIGMSGIRLEANIHIVTGAQSAAENIIKCVRRCGLEVEQLMLNPLASSQAVLTDDERELGVAVVDIGAGTTDVAIFTGGAIRHTAVIPAAGDLITSDIAMALRTPTKDAEDIKVESGYAKQLLADPEAQVEVPGLGDRGPRLLSRQVLAGVIEPRVEEIFSLVSKPSATRATKRFCLRALCSPEAARSCLAWWSWGKIFFSNRCAGVCPSIPAPWPTWWPSPVRPPSWGSWKKHAWHACAASRWRPRVAL